MKRFLLTKAERLRYTVLFLLSICAISYANAQLSSDEISAAILVKGSVPVKWTNDSEHPWYNPDGKNYVTTPVVPNGDSAFTSTLSFTYSSTYPTEITFEWRRYRAANGDILKLLVDGEEMRTTTYDNWNNVLIMIPAGSHIVEFVSVSTIENYYYDDYTSAVRTVRVWECKELESACLKEGSLPITFNNEEDIKRIWVAEDGYIRSSGNRDADSTTEISTKFTVDTPSLFAFEWRNLSNNSYYSKAEMYVDGLYYQYKQANNWNEESIVLYPGTHEIEFKHWSRYGDKTDILEIRNVRLDQNWYEVTLNNPGELGTRLTQALEGKPIQDMELLKIKGAMNSDDWVTIGLLTGIKAVDFTETGITTVPQNAFSGKSYLSTVILPETLTSIEDGAFYKTNSYIFNIPASVESIGHQVWKESNLRFISFPEDSKLSSIGYEAFYATRLIEFYMPDSVVTQWNKGSGTYYSSYLFAKCSSLKKLHLSENISYIPGEIASECSSLEEFNIPGKVTSIGYKAFYNTKISSIKIPENVTSLGNYSFYDCKYLKEVYLNSHCWDMNYTFRNCTALEKVVLPCATPPTISNDPFYGVTKNNVTLIVPDFAFDTYRANSYWYNFTNTVKGDEASINDYWAIRGTLNLNNTLVMQGKPSVEMMTGGNLTVDSNSTQTFKEFTYNTSESSPAVVLSQSNSVSADRLVSKFYVNTKDKWFFFSPVTDVNMSEVTYSSTDSWVLRYYDGASRASEDKASGNWKNVPADGTLKSGQGYIFQARETGWLSLPAASTEEHDKFFGTNAVTFELADNACETEANAGWNFVANPYPTYYDIYYIDMQAPITVWTGSTYKAYSLNDGDRGDDTFVLRPMQPFFVQKSAETPELSTGMPLVGRQINTAINRTRAPRTIVVDENRHKLNLELYCDDQEEADDYTRVVINEQASMAYESVRDASKFMSMDVNVAQLYTLGDNNHPMAINERPYEDGNVALGVLLPATDRTYRISAQRADRQAWLYDSVTGIEFDLTEGDYIFNASKTGIDNNRFVVRFAPAVTSIDGVESAAVKVVGNIGSISVTAPVGAAIAVYGTDGSIISNNVAENGNIEIEVAGGVYVVNVNGESFKTIVK